LSEGSLNEYNDSLIIWFAIYTPNENFFGEDSIEYIIINLNNPNDPETGWIYFHVLPVNDLPLLDELSGEVFDEDESVTKPFCWSDPEENDLVQFTTSSTEEENVSLSVQYDSGTCALLHIIPVENFNGELTATITISGTADPYCTNQIYDNFSDCLENDAFWYDVEAFSSSQSFDITIVPVNDPPCFNEELPDTLFFNIQEGDNWMFDITLFMYDVDGDSINFYFEFIYGKNIGLDDLNVEGNLFSFIPGNDFTGVIIFEICTDDSLERDIEDCGCITFYLIWQNVNDAPVLGNINADMSIDEDSDNYLVTITPMDIDIVEGIMDDLTITYTISNSTLFPDHNLDIETDVTDVERTITFTPAGNQYGSATLQISVSDGELSDTDEIILTVNPVNDAPILAAIGDLSFNEGGSLTVELNAMDIDSDASDLWFSVSGGTNISATILTNGSTTLELVSDSDYHGTEMITVTVCDNDFDNELCASEDISITVNSMNNAPIVEPVLEFYDVTDGYEFSIEVYDDDDEDEHEIIFTPYSSYNRNDNTLFGGFITGPDDGVFTYHTNENPYNFDITFFRATDGELLSNLGQIIFNIPTSEIDPPNTLNIHLDVIEDTPTEFALFGLDNESLIDENSAFAILTNTLHGELGEGSLIEYNDNMIFWLVSYAPDENFFGEDSLEYIIINLNNPNEPEPAWVYFHVLPVNDLPVLEELSDEEVDEDDAVTKPFCWSDPEENDQVQFTTYSTSDENVSLSVEYDSGTCAQLQIFPGENYNGELTATITISGTADPYCTNLIYDNYFDCIENDAYWYDAEEFSSSQSFTVIINPVNDPPLIITNPPGQFIIHQGLPWIFDMNLYIIDIEGDAIFYEWNIIFLDEIGNDDMTEDDGLFSFYPGVGFIGGVDINICFYDEFSSCGEVHTDTLYFHIDWVIDCNGDVSGDGNLDVIDIVQTVECILNNSDNCICADLDANGTIDVIDIVMMVDIILSGN
jgi:hypothetical protein